MHPPSLECTSQRPLSADALTTLVSFALCGRPKFGDNDLWGNRQAVPPCVLRFSGCGLCLHYERPVGVIDDRGRFARRIGGRAVDMPPLDFWICAESSSWPVTRSNYTGIGYGVSESPFSKLAIRAASASGCSLVVRCPPGKRSIRIPRSPNRSSARST